MIDAIACVIVVIIAALIFPWWGFAIILFAMLVAWIGIKS